MSLAMVAMQAPGSAVIVFFMAVVTKDNVTTWVSYLASAIQLFILLFLLIYFECKQRRAKKAYAALTKDSINPGDGVTYSIVPESDEHSKLLSDSDDKSSFQKEPTPDMNEAEEKVVSAIEKAIEQAPSEQAPAPPAVGQEPEPAAEKT